MSWIKKDTLDKYDEKYDKDKYRSFDRYPKRVKESIYLFVDPAPSMSIILDHRKGYKWKYNKRVSEIFKIFIP